MGKESRRYILSFDRKWEIIFKELYTFTGKEVVISLLMDLVKKTQKTPRKEILHALAIYKEFEEENDANS